MVTSPAICRQVPSNVIAFCVIDEGFGVYMKWQIARNTIIVPIHLTGRVFPWHPHSAVFGPALLSRCPISVKYIQRYMHDSYEQSAQVNKHNTIHEQKHMYTELIHVFHTNISSHMKTCRHAYLCKQIYTMVYNNRHTYIALNIYIYYNYVYCHTYTKALRICELRTCPISLRRFILN